MLSAISLKICAFHVGFLFVFCRLIDQRFTRLESHVITLARSVAHLSAELKSQNIIRQSLATLQTDIYELKARRANELSYLQERVRLVQTDKTSQKTIRKLRK